MGVEVEISVVVRIMPNNDEVDVSLPLGATAQDVIETMLEQPLGIPRIDQQGNTIVYKLVPKGRNEAIAPDQTLGQAQIQNGDIIYMVPNVIAG